MKIFLFQIFLDFIMLSKILIKKLMRNRGLVYTEIIMMDILC